MSDFPWVKRYPAGIPAEIDKIEHASLIEMFEDGFNKYTDQVAYENMGKSITYREMDDLSRNFAAYLQNKFGLEKGDTIAIQMPNLLQYPVALIGALRAGLTVVNTNPLYTPREMAHQFTDAKVKAIVIVSNFASTYRRLKIRQVLKI